MRILVADDQPAITEAARLLLKTSGHSALTAESPEAALRLAVSQAFDLVLMDLNYARDTTSGKEGLDLLAALRAAGVSAPVIVMTAWGSVELAVEAMRRGASDFVQKPWDNALLLAAIERHAAHGRSAHSELEIARNVQRNLLPKTRPEFPGLDYAARCIPARAIGGDYYDWFELGNGETAFVLADVCGKGIGAALLMANLQATLRTRIETDLSDPPAMIGAVNRQFWEASLPEQFATLLFLRYDATARRLSWVNAGHPAGILQRADGTLYRLEATALPVGAFRAWSSTESNTPFLPGDRLLLFSDGVVEAGADTREEFGEERLLAAMQADTAAAMVDSVCTCVAAWDHVAHDDCTVLAVKSC
ncbi:MAG TPA: SpoIIE family protein phosphatase [Bryobacteraceae bacterium]|nr:SpoIIE family protein phosphatase [Bryobacteraceae bacterium]